MSLPLNEQALDALEAQWSPGGTATPLIKQARLAIQLQQRLAKVEEALRRLLGDHEADCQNCPECELAQQAQAVLSLAGPGPGSGLKGVFGAPSNKTIKSWIKEYGARCEAADHDLRQTKLCRVCAWRVVSRTLAGIAAAAPSPVVESHGGVRPPESPKRSSDAGAPEGYPKEKP